MICDSDMNLMYCMPNECTVHSFELVLNERGKDLMS